MFSIGGGNVAAPISILALLHINSSYMLKEESFQSKAVIWPLQFSVTVLLQITSRYMLKEECFQSGAVMWPLLLQFLYYYILILSTY